MECQPQNPEFRNNPEIVHPCGQSQFLFDFGTKLISDIFFIPSRYYKKDPISRGGILNHDVLISFQHI